MHARTIFRQWLSIIFSEYAVDIRTRSSSSEANEWIQHFEPVLALVSLQLEDVDGIDWIKSIREADRIFPVVVLTGKWCEKETFCTLVDDLIEFQ